ncbi:MAG: Transcriptional regulator PadR-like family protein [Methanobacterium sp. PtaB.Bin024]|jgi:DNA-binding PadR family transcriptional regulator|nr:MAG: Transcriptional regulator PadR-like family protein [Methanobacterium sp. PtaB.Bin024]
MSLSYAMLGILSYGPMTGYGLKKVFDKSISQVWAASLSQIYRELSTLEKNGYVSSTIQKQEDRPDKRIYTITEIGKDAFLDWLGDFPEKLVFPQRDEFMLRIFFGSKLEKEEVIKQFERFIFQKNQYMGILSEIEDKFNEGGNEFVIGSAEKDKLFWHFTIKRSKMTLKTVIKWAEECIKELEQYDASEIKS